VGDVVGGRLAVFYTFILFLYQNIETKVEAQ
jgi:hypothetical protein